MLIKDFINAFQKGKALTNAAVWKNRAIATDLLAGLITSIVAIAVVLGYDLRLEDGTVQALAGGIAALVYVGSAVLHITTSDKVGLPSKTPGPSADVGVSPRGPEGFFN